MIDKLYILGIPALLSITPVSLIIINQFSKLFAKHHPKLGKTTTICTGIEGVLTKPQLEVTNILFDKYRARITTEKEFAQIEDLEDKRYYILSRIKQINMYFKKGSTKKDFNKDEERIRQALAQATKKFYKTINTENTCTLYKHIKNSIKVQNGYIYAPENNIDWVFSTE